MISAGDVVLYKLSPEDVRRITAHREIQIFGLNRPGWHGNDVGEGETYPLFVVRVWPNEFGAGKPGVNGQVMLDGWDSYWVTCVGQGFGEGQWEPISLPTILRRRCRQFLRKFLR